MNDGQFTVLAEYYDRLNGADYNAYAQYVKNVFEKYGSGKEELVLDLGCGTGKMTLELARRGYDMTGIDYSPEMLDIARSLADEEGHDILWLCQDMREFELYGTVDAAVCCLDCINHLEEEDDLDKCFKLVHNYLIPDGIFIFDINAKYKFENIYADNTFSMEEDGGVCIWENYYDPETKLCDFYITLFKECTDGRYERYDEEQSERMYTLEDIKASLERCNLEFISAYGDLDFSEGNDDCERIYIVAKCRKG